MKECEIIYDFSPNAKSNEEINRGKLKKRDLLVDILEYITGRAGVYTQPVLAGIMRMAYVNIVRILPIKKKINTGFDPEIEAPKPDPAWPHLKHVYDILRRVAVTPDTDSRKLKRWVTPHFLKGLLSMFVSEDFREREYLKVCVHRFYGKMMVIRSLVRKCIRNRFYLFIYEGDTHHGIAEMLEIIGSIINGFSVPLKQTHVSFLMRSLMPLHTSKWLKTYHVQLQFCVTQFIKKQKPLGKMVLEKMMSLWPAGHSRKQVLYLDEIEAILAAIRDEEDIEPMLRRLWTFLAPCIIAPHFLVSERILLFWQNEHMLKLIMDNSEIVVPLVYPYIRKTMNEHWNPNVKNLGAQIFRMIRMMEPLLCDACEKKYLSTPSEKRFARPQVATISKFWETAERAAAERKKKESAQRVSL